ncbi:MAG: PTS sugar transporter subunit IIA [Turicibacter sp.]
MSAQLFDVKYMDLELITTEKLSTIKHLASLLTDRVSDVDGYIKDVFTREAMSTTGIGDGVAIPHAKSAHVLVPTVVVGKSVQGIEWESLDELPVHLVFMIAVPENAGNDHLKILQKLAVGLMDDDFREELLTVTDKSVMEKTMLDSMM